MHRLLMSAFCAVFLIAGLAGPAAAKRVALVIGNDAYTNLPVLRKAANDARAVAAALKAIGFIVHAGENLSRRETNRKLADFETAIEPGDQAFFFFAGHGVSIGAENYLIPGDMPKPRAGEDGLVRDEAHSVSSIINRIQRRGAASSLFVLDACRDNPFAAAGVRSIGSTRGLTRVEAPSGVFVLFSAGIGQTALDRLSDNDPNPNSVFTRKLIPLLNAPGLTHVQLAKQVQKQVSALAGTVSHNQQPAYYDQIIGEIVLKPEPPKTTGTSAGQQTSAGPAQSDAAQTWNVIQNTTSAAVLEAFVGKFPSSVFTEFARARLQELKTGPAIEADPPDTQPRTTQQAAIDPEPVLTPDPKVLVRAIQRELNRHRCNAGPVDGSWGAKSRNAVASFAKHTKRSLAPAPSERLLKTLKATKNRACPTPVIKVKKQVAEPPKAAPLPATKVYRNPRVGGLPIDICLSPKKRCKGQAAQAYCRYKGYRVASASAYAVYPKTRHLATRGVCKPRGFIVCGGYTTITCTR